MTCLKLKIKVWKLFYRFAYLLMHLGKVLLQQLVKMSESTTQQAQNTWIVPITEPRKSVLKLYNTLTHSKVPFKPINEGKIKWYSCGPTVYNSSHMGHARNYVSIDINRRILEDYFNYDITFIQNVTDIDDKIIIKAREEELFKRFIEKVNGNVNEEILNEVWSSWDQFVIKNVKYNGSRDEFGKWFQNQDLIKIGTEDPKLVMYMKGAFKAWESLNDESKSTDINKFLENTKDVFVPILDEKYKSTITDHSIFRKCSSYWEKQYDLDMKKLNVREPSIITRVSEYVPEIVKFIEGIINNGFAYVSNDGSVYFNTSKFDNDSSHSYAKCQPWSKGDMSLIEDGEGKLSSNNGKLNSSDFALWKSSKLGEPYWESPWGKGRPGWHIECSVMGGDFVGEHMDIHSGGIDLAFPHHDNELAQSEAYFECKQWVNYFLHTGHLHIEGQKMSKSLKNFITIEDALMEHSSRQLRLIFALVPWNNGLDFKKSLLNEAKSIESTFDKYFSKIRALINEKEGCEFEEDIKKYGEEEKKLMEDFEKMKDIIHDDLCDNLNTAGAIRHLLDIINLNNIYISKKDNKEIRIDEVKRICEYVSKMLGIFGFEVRKDGYGWEVSNIGVNGDSGNNSNNKEEIILPIVKLLSEFRDNVRNIGIKKKDENKEISGIILKMCDEIRDKLVVEGGVGLEDREGENNGALIKMLSSGEIEEYRTNLEQREAREAAKLEKKRLAQEKAAREEAEERSRAQIETKDLFRDSTLYSEWDEEGVPLKSVNGEEVSKSSRKKMVKQMTLHNKLREKYGM